MIVSPFSFFKKICLPDRRTLPQRGFLQNRKVSDRSSLKSAKEGKIPKEVELDLSKTQLASKLGTISETLSRTLAKMKTKGIIDVEKNKISILNREALEELASGLKI